MYGVPSDILDFDSKGNISLNCDSRCLGILGTGPGGTVHNGKLVQ